MRRSILGKLRGGGQVDQIGLRAANPPTFGLSARSALEDQSHPSSYSHDPGEVVLIQIGLTLPPPNAALVI